MLDVVSFSVLKVATILYVVAYFKSLFLLDSFFLQFVLQRTNWFRTNFNNCAHCIVSDRKSILALYLLPSLLPPSLQTTADRKRWKPSINESRTNFIDLQKASGDIISIILRLLWRYL